ncbi:hypothetical protein AB0M44_46815 [Streptosporangium subroseum]|uniref:hypothetical protein n=1 Tax=Streptosporangium subroseum TaxID=106412 RepID=UPI00343C5EC1
MTATADDRRGNVVPIRSATADLTVAAALAVFTAHLDRCALAANTVAAYRDWLLARAAEHADAFAHRGGPCDAALIATLLGTGARAEDASA